MLASGQKDNATRIMLGSTNTTLPLTTSEKQKAVRLKISTLPSYVREKSSNIPVFRAFWWPYFVPKVVNQLVAAAAPSLDILKFCSSPKMTLPRL